MHTRAGLLILLVASAGAAAIAANGLGALALQQPAPAVRQPLPAPPQAGYQAPRTYSPIAADIARWSSLRQADNLPFSSYASFLIGHRGWPAGVSGGKLLK